MVDYGVVGYRYEEKDKSRGKIVTLFLGKEKFNEEISEEDHTDPKLYLHELRFVVESLVVIGIDRYADHKEDREGQNQDVKECVYTTFLKDLVQALGLGRFRVIILR